MDLKNMKALDYVGVFFKGILLGLISVGIPGISASTIGIIIGIYYLMVESIANIFKDFKHNFPFLIILMIGYGLGAIGAAATVSLLFEHFPLLTTMAILGLLFGSMPDMLKDLKIGFKQLSNWIVLIIIVALLITYNFTIQANADITFPTSPDWKFLLIMAFVGLVTSATFVIPGIDFAVVFMSMGIYYAFTNMILDLVSFGSDTYLQTFVANAEILGCYLVGYLLGIFLISKLIKKVSQKFDTQSKFAAFAFILASPIILVKMCIFDNSGFDASAVTKTEIVVGLGILVLFMWLTIYIGKRSREKKEAKESGSTVDNKWKLDRRLRKVFFRKIFKSIYLDYSLGVRKSKGHSIEEAYSYCVEFVDEYFDTMDVVIERHGVENIQIPGGITLMGNHQSKNDALIVLGSIREHPATFLINDDRSHMFLMREIVDYMQAKRIKFNDLKDQVKVYKEIAENLESGTSYIIFPEAMYKDNKNSLLIFNTPCFVPSIKSQTPIVPFVLFDTWKTVDDEFKGTLTVQIHFLNPIFYEEYKDLNKRELAMLVRNRIEEKLTELNAKATEQFDEEFEELELEV